MDDIQKCRARLERAEAELDEKVLDLENAEADCGEFAADIVELEGEIGDLEEELEALQEFALQGNTKFFSSIGAKPTIVRDEHDKLRYSDREFEILLLAGGDIYGCNDFAPYPDSECEYVGEIHWCDGG